MINALEQKSCGKKATRTINYFFFNKMLWKREDILHAQLTLLNGRQIKAAQRGQSSRGYDQWDISNFTRRGLYLQAPRYSYLTLLVPHPALHTSNHPLNHEHFSQIPLIPFLNQGPIRQILSRWIISISVPLLITLTYIILQNQGNSICY